MEADQAVGVVLEAKLFGRLRLLTIDAVVEVGQPRRPPVLDAPVFAGAASTPCRSSVEALLAEAREALEGAPPRSATDHAVRR